MKKYFSFGILLSLATLTGCVSSNYSYKPPLPMLHIESSITVNEVKTTVWSKLVKGIGANFFVINNMDKESGFINVSYSGDPEKYIVGGELNYEFSNLRGARKYNFPATRANAQYETTINGNLCFITRKMDLDGRMNILISEVDSTHTLVSVNTRYIITMNLTGTDAMGRNLQPYQETISFNTGQSGKSTGGGEYYSNGEFERAILDLVR